MPSAVPLRPALLFLTLLFTLATGFLSGCSSSRAPEVEAPTGPPYALLYATEAGHLVLYDVHADSSQTLVEGARFTGARAASPNERHLAFSYATVDSSHLALLNLETRKLEHVHAQAGTVTYSLAWHPEDGRIAFAYYAPTAEGGRGPGGVHIATPGGATRSVGCRAAREVLHWLPDGTLATRNDNNIYVVATDDCATRASIDVRRMHHLRYAADGRRLAYIYRTLTYDRSAGTYVPDSSLFTSNAHGEDAEKLFGNDRRARHLRWAPDAPELAFDVHLAETARRAVVVYDAEHARTVYLIPPEQAPDANQLYPRWSPSGHHIAFTLREDDRATAAVRVEGQTRRLGPTAGPVWGWVDDRSLVLRGPDSLRITTLQGKIQYTQSTPTALVYVWDRPAV